MKTRYGLVTLPLVVWTVNVYPAAADPPKLDDQRRFAEPVRAENLTVWPIVSDAPVETGKYLTLAAAQESGLAEVREKGQVNELVVENKGDRPIFVPAGTIVKGGKQDRQLGQDLVIDGGKTVAIQAFCVEHGRWNGTRDGKRTGDVFEVSTTMASKRVRSQGRYVKDQGGVWEQVAAVNAKTGKAPATGTFLATIDDNDQNAVATRRRMAETVRRHFSRMSQEAHIVGFAYSVNGEPLALRTFANSSLFADHFEPFLQTMSLEAQVAQDHDRAADRPIYDQIANVDGVLALVRGVGKAPVKTEETSGENREVIQANEWGGHAATVVESADGKQVTLSEDWTAAAEIAGEAREELRRLRALGYTN